MAEFCVLVAMIAWLSVSIRMLSVRSGLGKLFYVFKVCFMFLGIILVDWGLIHY